jgi:beta-phosphoglucomutase family hydrolase
MAFKAAIFDMDGVIVDSHPIHKNAWKRFLTSVGHPFDDADLDFVLDGRKREDILRHFLGDLSDQQIEEYGRMKESLFREEALEMETISGLLDLLRDAKNAGISMAVASSGSSSRVHFILDHLGIQEHFSIVVTGDDVAHGKPNPEIFRKAAQLLAARNDETLVIEDAVSGVIAAKNAGMKCMAIASNGRAEALRTAGAEIVVADFKSVTLARLAALFN